MWRSILAYGDRKKAICFDKNCNLTVKINTQSNKNGMVDEKYVLSTFPIVSLNNTEAFMTLVIWNTCRLWVRTKGIVSHCTSHYSIAVLDFISRNNTAALHSGNVAMWVLLTDESWRLSKMTKLREPQEDLLGPRTDKCIWSFLICSFGCWQSRRPESTQTFKIS